MRRIGLVALSALLYASAFPPLACTPLAWVALVPLLVAIAPASPRRAALLGLVWGVLMALGVGWPLAGMLGRYFGTPPWIGWLAWLAVAVFAAGVHYAAFAAWVAWLVRRGRGAPLAIAAGWALTELVRGRYAPQNPWALIAYSQTEWPRIVQIADLAGPYGIGFVVVAANAALAGLVCRRLAGRHPGWSTAGVAALVALTLGYGEWRLDTADGAARPLEVAVVQPGRAPADAQAYARLTRAAADGGADLVVWPEHAVGEYVQEPSPARDLVLAASRRTGADLVLGAPSYDAGAGGPTYHNSVFLVRDGTLAGRYDKQRLLPVAEDGALATMLPGAGRYASGRPVRGLRARDALVGASICFEAMYPELVRGIVAGGAELLVNVSNDVWFGHASPAETHLAMAALRAVENRRWLVRAAATGVSAVVDPAGRVVARAEFGVPGVVSATVRPLHVRTPYQRWGDGAAWLLAALAAAASLRRPRKTQLAHVEGGTS